MMKRILIAMVGVTIIGLTLTAAMSREPAVEFKRAQMRVEINATDGDAGVQIDLDHEPWRSVTVRNPQGEKILDVANRGVLKDYGLTELFSESSEPPFTEFPLAEFLKLFPEGDYLFEGTTIDGQRMKSAVTLTHKFPNGPVIVSPSDDSTVRPRNLVVGWEPVTTSGGVDVVAYQVLVISEEDPTKVFSAHVPSTVTSVSVPAEFLAVLGPYKAEVLAIEVGGNQTLSEVAFSVG